MTIQGTFTDISTKRSEQERYTVTISDGGGSTVINIIDPTENYNSQSYNQLFFASDPVHITCDRTDLTQLVMISQVTIKLVASDDMTNFLFADTNRDISVTIERTTEGSSASGVIFYGYVDPLQFDQGFAHPYEGITITATDPLGALEQLKIDDLDISQGDVLPVMSLIYKIFEKVFEYDTSNYNGLKTYFANAINPNSIKVNVSVFFGDDEDDYMTLREVLDELLKYLGCTVCYEPKGGTVNIFNLYSGGSGESGSIQWFDGKEDAMDSSASLSMDDVYSTVTLECDIEPVEDEIKLIDDELMYSDYSTYQKYMSELVAPGEGTSAYEGFAELVLSEDGQESTNYDAGYILDHFCYVKRSTAWKFGSNSYITAMGGREGDTPTPMTGDQSDVLRWLKNNDIKAAFVSFGKGNKVNYKDNSPVNNISLTDYLVISINGHNDHSENGHNLSMFNTIQRNSPICSYTGLSSVNLTPTDDTITNYIVISGKMILNPLMPKTGPNWFDDPNYPGGGLRSNLYNSSTNTFNDAKNAVLTIQNEGFWAMFALWHKTVPHPDNGDGAYYQQKWWKCSDPKHPVYTFTNNTGILGYLDNKEMEQLRYTYTAYSGYSGNEEDVVSKLPILACQLKIGDKWCVERLDKGEAGQGIYEWMTLEEWENRDNDPTGPQLRQKGYDKPYFTIGIDPKTDDKIVGHSFGIQNNIWYHMNIDASGTCIPIHMDDKLNGVPEFSILGPINQMWNEIERLHPSFWRHTSWRDHRFWTLELLDSILISDFKIEFKTDNALNNSKKTQADNDLVYASDTNPRYTEKLECDLKICTPLTMEECEDKGIKYQMSNSYVMNINDEPFYGWKSGNSAIKPEHLFIDYFYKQYSEPARIINTCVDNGYAFGAATNAGTYLGFSTILSQFLVTMNFPGLGTADSYYCTSMDWSLKKRENSMTLRQRLAYSNPF